MNLRDFLQQREKELAEQAVSLRQQLPPLEAELAETKRAKTAIGQPTFAWDTPGAGWREGAWKGTPPEALSTALRQFLERREQELMVQIGELHSRLGPLETELGEIKHSKAAIGIVQAVGTAHGTSTARAIAVIATPGIQFNPRYSIFVGAYDHMTMKQLIVKVLREHFHQGATARQMLDFFRDAWARDIERTNLSPQLSRLFQDRIIGRRDDHHWFLLSHPAADEPKEQEPPLSDT